MYYSSWLDLASVARLHKEVLDFIRYHFPIEAVVLITMIHICKYFKLAPGYCLQLYSLLSALIFEVQTRIVAAYITGCYLIYPSTSILGNLRALV